MPNLVTPWRPHLNFQYFFIVQMVKWVRPILYFRLFYKRKIIVQFKLLMTGFEPGSSGIEIDRVVKCATTTALEDMF